MAIFKRDPVKRLNEDELRITYLESKRSEKLLTFVFMAISSIMSIAIISFSISKKLYWILIFALITIIWFIRLINKLSTIIEEVFENREEEHD